jgi:CDP-diacylglycerol--serine O-phosphatidyltransferase
MSLIDSRRVMGPVLPLPSRPDRPPAAVAGAPQDGRRRPRRRPRLVALAVLPTLVTLGNVLAGFLAMSYVVDAWGAGTSVAVREGLWAKAAWAIGVGMVCDVLDGRVARLTGAASSFGAELDSLADMLTFGAAPALLGKSVVESAFPSISPRLTTALAMIYLLGAALRLARYNVESNRVQEPGHVTVVFRGLPSPGAAGVVASLVLLRHEFPTIAWLDGAILLAAPLAGVLMVSRFAYPHVMNRLFRGRRSPLAILLLVVAGVYFAWQHPVESGAAIFCAYAISGPLVAVARATVGRPRWASDEDSDEEDDEDVPPTDGTEPGAGGDAVLYDGSGEPSSS